MEYKVGNKTKRKRTRIRWNKKSNEKRDSTKHSHDDNDEQGKSGSVANYSEYILVEYNFIKMKYAATVQYECYKSVQKAFS